MTMCKDLKFDILALSETHKWRYDTDAIFSEQPEDGDPYSGCCICLSKRAKGAIMYSGAIGSRSRRSRAEPSRKKPEILL